MKRDMDTVRELLLWMEAKPDGLFTYHDLPGFPDFESTIEYVQLLTSGGFLTAPTGTTRSFRMTWEGHDFLDKTRDEEVWSKTKAGAAKLGSWSVKILSDLASGFIKQKAAELGLPLG